MEIVGYLFAALIGLSLGLVGGGGSILTVPLLVYAFGLGATDATASSLAIVGVTALFGAVDHGRRGNVDYRAALGFAIPSVAGVYLMRRYVIPSLPENLFSLGMLHVTKDRLSLVLFGVLMLFASMSMIRNRAEETPVESSQTAAWRLAIQGFATGTMTGSVGAGGGFLIVPALVLLARIPMRRAVATSLLVIAVNSLLGFMGDLQSGRAIDWPLVSAVSAIAVGGALIGSYLGRFVSGAKLKSGFGYLVLVTGLFVVAGEVLKSASLPSPTPITSTTTEKTMNLRQDITPEQLAADLKSPNPPLLVDVREEEERSISRLPNDLHIPMHEISGRLGELDRSSEIVLYCRTGNRSGIVADALASKGYRVRNLAGGINAWARRVDPTVRTY
ncbi:MAG TPA: TSUP family transporter [Fimbriimonas sp.]